MSDYLRFIILLAAGWISKDQQKIIDYLLEEVRVYQEHFKGTRLRFTDEQRRRLGVKAKALGRKTLEQFALERSIFASPSKNIWNTTTLSETIRDWVAALFTQTRAWERKTASLK